MQVCTASPLFENYVQSPIGLVPKAEDKTRLIFHLLYNFRPAQNQQSINHHIPDDICSVKYNDLDYAVRNSLRMLKQQGFELRELFYSKTDCSSAFRVLPVKVCQRCLLVLKMRHPETGKLWYFVDKCLPFGASISCALYQSFSNALKHIMEWKIVLTLRVELALTNYLDDFLFVALTIALCNGMMQIFLDICKTLGVLVSEEKTEWATSWLVFLGILLNGKTLMLSIPVDKRDKAVCLLKYAIDKKKTTVRFIQQLTGTLNFLNRAIVPGRAFTRGMYSHLALRDKKNRILKQHHHVNLNREFIADCKVWLSFLTEQISNCSSLCRPFIDFHGKDSNAKVLAFYSDASRVENLGMGAVFENSWIMAKWGSQFIRLCQPSIEFLELFALTVAVLTWRGRPELKNARIIIFCDNESVLHMVNNAASSCTQCRKLIRILTLDGIKNKRTLFVRHVRSENNDLADALL